MYDEEVISYIGNYEKPIIQICVCVVCSWCVHGVFMVCAWCVHGVFMVCSWHPHLSNILWQRNHTC